MSNLASLGRFALALIFALSNVVSAAPAPGASFQDDADIKAALDTENLNIRRFVLGVHSKYLSDLKAGKAEDTDWDAKIMPALKKEARVLVKASASEPKLAYAFKHVPGDLDPGKFKYKNPPDSETEASADKCVGCKKDGSPMSPETKTLSADARAIADHDKDLDGAEEVPPLEAPPVVRRRVVRPPVEVVADETVAAPAPVAKVSGGLDLFGGGGGGGGLGSLLLAGGVGALLGVVIGSKMGGQQNRGYYGPQGYPNYGLMNRSVAANEVPNGFGGYRGSRPGPPFFANQNGNFGGNSQFPQGGFSGGQSNLPPVMPFIYGDNRNISGFNNGGAGYVVNNGNQFGGNGGNFNFGNGGNGSGSVFGNNYSVPQPYLPSVYQAGTYQPFVH